MPGGNRPRHVEAAIRPARPGDLVQRAPPLRRGVRVGAALEQHRCQLVVSVVHRQHQRAHAVRQTLVDVRASIEQRARGIEVTAAHREQQRREHTRCRLGVDVGAGLHQHADGLNVVLAGGPHQGRLPAPRLARVDLGTFGDQYLDGRRVARASRHHQRCLASRRCEVRLRPGGQQPVDDRRVSVGGRAMDRGDTVTVDDLRLCARGQQHRDEGVVVVLNGPVESGRAVGFRRGDIRLLRQKRSHRPQIARLHGVDEGERSRGDGHRDGAGERRRTGHCGHGKTPAFRAWRATVTDGAAKHRQARSRASGRCCRRACRREPRPCRGASAADSSSAPDGGPRGADYRRCHGCVRR